MLGGRIAAPDQPATHEHVSILVEVSYDDLGHAVREFTCSSCSAVWFA